MCDVAFEWECPKCGHINEEEDAIDTRGGNCCCCVIQCKSCEFEWSQSEMMTHDYDSNNDCFHEDVI